ncbi:hypothetical protein RJ639_000778 [Escallonia herrerae]|uniref:Zinc finger, CCHC-type n=1 Tax=Escallonia herrerae TaxID=1293975 RepID=A0AA89BHN7_9ASTE|nr:hypothetical protein RJ639_000778 [Escallonia herrerae]
MVNAKALWESLERKYKTEDAGSKKFVVGKFLDFKMVDSKTVISQVQEFQLILHDIHAEGMVLGESFQVAALIEKLPPTWKDFKNYLKHKRKEMKLEDLIVRLRIEEDNRQSEKKAGNYHQEAKANVVEQGVYCTIEGEDPSPTATSRYMKTERRKMKINEDTGRDLDAPCFRSAIFGAPVTVDGSLIAGSGYMASSSDGSPMQARFVNQTNPLSPVLYTSYVDNSEVSSQAYTNTFLKLWFMV